MYEMREEDWQVGDIVAHKASGKKAVIIRNKTGGTYENPRFDEFVDVEYDFGKKATVHCGCLTTLRALKLKLQE